MHLSGQFIYRSILVLITISITSYLTWIGYDFYQVPLDERFYHEKYEEMKASGLIGHGLGIYGTLIIFVGVFGYIYAKKTLRFEKYIRLKYLLEFHIFLCTIGPIMILFHTTFKFGGLVSIGFWSMVIVVLSGVIGRYIYIQIPRKMNGQELNASEIAANFTNLWEPILALAQDHLTIREKYLIFEKANGPEKIKALKELYSLVITIPSIPPQQLKAIRKTIHQLQILAYRVARLDRMRKLFKYWHVFHKPFAIIMLVIVVIHIGVAFAMGYTYF
jgi:hypothetical protein